MCGFSDKGVVHKLRLQDLSSFDHLRPSVYIFYGIKVYKKSIFLTTYPPPLVNVVCERPLHCWKKKRDFLIIRSKVGGFLSLTVDGNEYFVGWKENLVHKYHQKWLPIICESRLMFHHIHPIIRSKVGGFLILSVANCEYFVC